MVIVLFIYSLCGPNSSRNRRMKWAVSRKCSGLAGSIGHLKMPPFWNTHFYYHAYHMHSCYTFVNNVSAIHWLAQTLPRTMTMLNPLIAILGSFSKWHKKSQQWPHTWQHTTAEKLNVLLFISSDASERKMFDLVGQRARDSCTPNDRKKTFWNWKFDTACQSTKSLHTYGAAVSYRRLQPISN